MEAITGAVQSFSAVSSLREAAPVPKPEAQPPAKPAPVLDQYVPGEAHAPSGLYWIARGEDGAPKVYFDDPEAKPASGGRAEPCTTRTDTVDRALEQLRRRREELEQRLGAETDPSRAQALEQKLTRVEAELAQKDNDAYRRQTAVDS